MADTTRSMSCRSAGGVKRNPGATEIIDAAAIQLKLLKAGACG